MARGLGSSSACIVAGILGANALLGNKLTSRQMLTLATAIEGTPITWPRHAGRLCYQCV